MKIYHVETQEDYDALMIELEEKGFEWLSGHEPTDFNYWKSMKEYNCIKISDKYITIGYLEQYKNRYPDILIIEYKAKGDNEMANKECNQRHKKWHQDSAKYCSWCGNKLVSEPKFKVGDYVTVYVDDRTIIARIDELMVNEIEVHGLWYDRTLVNVKQDYWFSSGLNDFRHARPTEIAEYEVALTFHKHGRKPFEVKEGDILKDNKGNILINDENILRDGFPKKLKKKYFTSGRYTFLKTAEEANEWLENK